MAPRSSASSSPAGPLGVDPRGLPVPLRRRARARAAVGGVLIAGLALGTAAVGAMAWGSLRAVPAAELTQREEISASAVDPEAPAAADGGLGAEPITVTSGAGQPMWLAYGVPPTNGVAVLLPDAGEDPRTLITGPVATALRGQGWTVATGALGGTSWGSPASSTALGELRDWAESQTESSPVVYIGAGMGGTTALTGMLRDEGPPVACWYTVAPVTDLVAAVTDDASIGEQIVSAWRAVPPADQNPILAAPELPLETLVRIVVPRAPQSRADDARGLATSLQQSGHTVSTVELPEGELPGAATEDLFAFLEGCST